MAGSDRATKILLKFKNFANNFSGAFYTDYAFIADKKKVFLSGTEYERTVNRNGIGQHLGCTPINLDSDWDNCIRRMEFSMLSIYQLVTKHFQRVISQQ